MAEYNFKQPRSPTWSGSPSEIEKEKRRQDSLDEFIHFSQFPTIKSQSPSRTPSNKRRHSFKEAQLSVEELERPRTPTWYQTTKPTRKETYQGWHLQFIPTHRPAVVFAFPQCLKFDSRHWNEFPRPKGKKIRCEGCGQYLGYLRSEKAFDEGKSSGRGYKST